MQKGHANDDATVRFMSWALIGGVGRGPGVRARPTIDLLAGFLGATCLGARSLQGWAGWPFACVN